MREKGGIEASHLMNKISKVLLFLDGPLFAPPIKKISASPFLPMIGDQILEEKVALIMFRQVLAKMRIFDSSIMVYLKKFVLIKSIKRQL